MPVLFHLDEWTSFGIFCKKWTLAKLRKSEFSDMSSKSLKTRRFTPREGECNIPRKVSYEEPIEKHLIRKQVSWSSNKLNGYDTQLAWVDDNLLIEIYFTYPEQHDYNSIKLYISTVRFYFFWTLIWNLYFLL